MYNLISIKLLYIFIFHELTFTHANDDSRLAAVTGSPFEYIFKLYEEEQNEDEPSNWDRTYANASARLQVCNEITDSDIFEIYNLLSVDVMKIQEELKESYPDIFRHIYSVKKLQEQTQSPDQNQLQPPDDQNQSQSPDAQNQPQSSDEYEYTNPYIKKTFEFINFAMNENREFSPKTFEGEESVFICLLRQKFSKKIIPFYVSKAYNEFYDIRYLLPETIDETAESESEKPRTELMLSEKSARAYMVQGFNVELHYLEVKEHHLPASSYEVDPVCQYNFAGALQDFQVFRLCTIVLQSPFFKTKVKYPLQNLVSRCYTKEISFKSKEAIEKAKEKNGTTFSERMILCRAPRRDSGKPELFFISRAYNPTEVFVYTDDPDSDGKVKLENLSINVNLVHERYNLHDIEI